MRKKVVLINVILGLIFIGSVISFSVLINIASARWNYWNSTAKEMLEFVTDKYQIEELRSIFTECVRLTVSIVFSVLGAILSAFTIGFLNLKVFNSVSFAELQASLKEKAENRKTERAQAKTEREKANRQARIEELEKELAELKESD